MISIPVLHKLKPTAMESPQQCRKGGWDSKGRKKWCCNCAGMIWWGPLGDILTGPKVLGGSPESTWCATNEPAYLNFRDPCILEVYMGALHSKTMLLYCFRNGVSPCLWFVVLCSKVILRWISGSSTVFHSLRAYWWKWERCGSCTERAEGGDWIPRGSGRSHPRYSSRYPLDTWISLNGTFACQVLKCDSAVHTLCFR